MSLTFKGNGFPVRGPSGLPHGRVTVGWEGWGRPAGLSWRVLGSLIRINGPVTGYAVDFHEVPALDIDPAHYSVM